MRLGNRMAIYASLVLSGCQNLDPGPAVVALGPEVPTTLDDLELTIVADAPDADGDSLDYTIQWTKDGEVQDDLAGEMTVPSDRSSKGQAWSALVTANDGKADGPTVTATVTIVNSPPTAVAEITPSNPDNTQDLVVAVTASDVDDDTVDLSYEWSVDGVETDFTGTSIPSSDLISGQTWEVTVTPSDMVSVGDPATATATITNGAPVIAQMAILPVPARVVDELSVDITASDTDGHTITYSYVWYVGGLSVSTEATLSNQFIRGDEVSVEVTPSDGLVDGQMASASIVIENTAPELSAAILEPEDIFEASVVTCTGWGWVDPDGDSQIDLVSWTVDDVEVSTSASIAGDLFSRGNEVACTVIPFDGEDMGPSVESAAAIVKNSVPTVSSVGFSTLTPTSTSGITAIPVAEDEDGDPLTYVYYWTVGGQPIMLPTDTNTLGKDDFDVGDTITVLASACDPVECGVGVPSTETAVVANSVPVIDSVILSPSPDANTDDVIVASVVASDDDGDSVAVSYEWSVNGATVAQSTSSLDGATYFDKGDSVDLTVTPTDGTDDGAAFHSDTVWVVNTPPTAPVVEITPDRAVAGDHDLQCAIVTESEDVDGDDVSYTFSWTVDGADAGNATSTVSTADIQAGETWACLVTPSDGTVDGTVGMVSTLVANWPTNWVNAYYEDFSDGAAEDFETYGGACGGQSGESDGSTYFWRFTSDWNGARLPIPNLGTSGLAFETRLRFFDDSTASSVRWRSNEISWDANDDAGYTLSVQLGASEETFGEDELCVDFCSDGTALDLDPDTWLSYRVEEWDGEYRVFIDEQQVFEGDIADLPSAGDSLEFTGGGDCGSSILEIDYVVIQSAATLSENNPPEAPVANLHPLVPVANQDDLTCVVDVVSFDADGDVAAYQFDWTVNDSSFDQTEDTYSSGDTVPSASVSWGDHWECVVTPYDGKESGIATSVEVVVVPRDCAAPENASADGSLAQVGNDPSLSLDSGDFTVEAWVQASSALGADDRRILGVFDGTYSQWILEYNGTQGGVGALFTDGVSQIEVYGTDSLSVGDWHHVAVTRAVDEFSVWINGVESANTSSSATLASLTADLFVGNIEDDVGAWQGLVDEVRISSTARYTAAFTPARTFEADNQTVGLWHLDSRSSEIYDASGNGYHGVVTDGTWSDASVCEVFEPRVAAGGAHTCMLSETGVVCIGDDAYGQLDGPMGEYHKVYAGLNDSCAISDAGLVECWGQLAYSVGGVGSARDLGMGWFHRCAVGVDDALECWGVSDGSIFDHGQVSDAPAMDAVDVAAGAYYSCAVGRDGQLVCWGRDLHGEASPPSGTYESVSAGLYHACALDTFGQIQCWGIDDGSSLDSGQVSSAPGGSYIAVSSGDYHSCALDEFGSVSCWGRDDEEQASPPAGSFIALSAGGLHSCAVEATGTLECWGSDDVGQISGGGSDTGGGGSSVIPPGECASLAFDGVDDVAYLTSGTVAGLGSGELSLEFWMRPDTVGQAMTLFHWGDDDLTLENEFIWLQLNVDGKVVATVRGDNGANSEATVSSTTVLTPGVWTHVHMQRDPGISLELYIDGSLEMTAVDDAGVVGLVEERPLLLGMGYDFATANRIEAFAGSLSEVRAWTRLLDTVELVEKSYQQLDPATETDLFAYWPLNEGAGADVLDLVTGDYGQVFDDALPSAVWNIGVVECRETPLIGDTGDSGMSFMHTGN